MPESQNDRDFLDIIADQEKRIAALENIVIRLQQQNYQTQHISGEQIETITTLVENKLRLRLNTRLRGM